MTTQTQVRSTEEAFKLALEALEWATSCIGFEDFDDMTEALEELNKAHQAITAIKEALSSPNGEAQPAEGEDTQRAWVNATTWRGLTDEEVKHMLELFVVPPHHVDMVVQAIEAKLKEKNT